MLKEYISLAILTIIIFLLVKNASGAETVIKSFSSFNTGAINALQGQNVSTL